MRLLIVTSELPYPPVTGTRLVLHELLGHITARHDVTMIGYRWHEQQRVDLPAVEVHELPAPVRSRLARARSWLVAGRTGEPVQAQGIVAPLAEALPRVGPLRDFDVVHVTGPVVAGIAPHLGGRPAVLAALDAWHLNARAQTEASRRIMRPLRRLEERRIERFQTERFGAFDSVVVVAEEDARAVRALVPGQRVEVVPNGVDAKRFSPGPPAAEPGLVVFVGTMRWAPNIRAARFLAHEVLPRLRERHPEARLQVVGRAAGPELREELERCAGVEVVGEVPDVVPWLRRGAVFACPMLDGTGIKNKVLEALACGRPTVATALACQGMAVRDGHELLVAEEPEAFAAAVGRLLDDAELAGRLGAAGREHVVRNHGWEAVAATLGEVYAAAAAQEEGIAA